MAIIVVLSVLLFVSPAFAQGQKQKVADAKIVTKTGDSYTARFVADEDGERREVILTGVEYQALGQPNGGAPPGRGLPANKTWRFRSASKNDVYSTPSGRLEPGNIYLHNKNEALLVQSDDAPLSLPLATYTITEDALKRPTIKPDPPGLEIKDGTVLKEERGGGPR